VWLVEIKKFEKGKPGVLPALAAVLVEWSATSLFVKTIDPLLFNLP